MSSSPANDKRIHPIPACQLTVRIAGLATAGAGIFALMGWLLGMPRLASLGANLIPMAPSTALLFILFGVALNLCSKEPLPRIARRLCLAIAVPCTLIALALFVAAIRGVQWNAELLGLSLDIPLQGMPIGHMSPVGAICFMLTGVSFLVPLISTTRRIWSAWVALSLSVILLIICIILLMAYFMESPLFYGGSVIPPAMTTMLAFTAMGIGLWAYAYLHAWPKSETLESTLSARAGIAMILIFCLLVIGIISLGSLYYRTYERRFRAEAEQQLTTIANLKVDELVQWRKERLGDAVILFKNSAFAAIGRRCMDDPNDAEAQTQLRIWLSQIQSQYDRVCLYDAQGVARMSVPDVTEPVPSDFLRCAAEARRTRQIVFEDFYRNEYDRRIYLSVLIPILDEQNGNQVIGILALRIDPETYLFPSIQHWPIPSETAETLLVRREGNAAVFLNELRFQKGAPLAVRSPLSYRSQPAVKAVMGYEGIVEGPDYRDVPVVAAVCAIPDSPWFLVAGKDLTEISAPLRERLGMTIFLATVLLFGAGAAVWLIWQHHSARVYREKLFASEALRQEQSLMLTLMENLPDRIYFKDTASRFLRVNRAMLKLFGLDDPAQIIGKSDADFFSVEHAQQALIDERKIIDTGRPLLNIEEKETWVDGADSWALTSKLPLRNDTGHIIGTCGISTDITNRKRAEAELQRAETELQEKNAELGRFLYTASHDLKSPLVTVKTFLGYLVQDLAASDSVQIEKDMSFINAAADKMARLLDELLEMSRIGRVTSPPVRITFQALVDEALGAAAGRIAERGVSVKVDADARDLMLQGDRLRLAEIWQNLVDNACKFMGDQKEPRIEIGTEERGGETLFFVRDNGSGIDSRYLSKVFGLFEKLDPKADGTGIGLAHVKRIVEIHRGRIWVESAGVGMGANFLFTLPDAINIKQDGEK